MRPHKITRRGIARTFQNIRLFDDMTALENVIVGADARHRSSVVGALLGLPRLRGARSGEAPARAGAAGVRRDRRPVAEAARNLPYGDQRRLEIARALATGPQLLLLDEPAAGFNPSEKTGLMELIRRIRDDGVTVLLIEHDMSLVMGVTDRIVVLEFGQQDRRRPAREVREDPAVIAAYLGEVSDAS